MKLEHPPMFRSGVVAALAAATLCLQAQAAVNSVLLFELPTPPPGFVAGYPVQGVGGWMPLQEPSRTFDLNADGVVDIEFTIRDRDGTAGSGAVAAVIPLGGSLQILGAPYFPDTLSSNGQAAPIFAGELIGLDTPSIFLPGTEVAWTGVDFRNGQFDMLFPPIRRVGGPTTQFGTFVGPEIYLGFRLWEEDGWHYGRMRLSGDQGYGLVVHEYAYETEPNTPIMASRSIPEPGPVGMLGIGGLSLMLRRRRFTPIRE